MHKDNAIPRHMVYDLIHSLEDRWLVANWGAQRAKTCGNHLKLAAHEAVSAEITRCLSDVKKTLKNTETST